MTRRAPTNPQKVKLAKKKQYQAVQDLRQQCDERVTTALPHQAWKIESDRPYGFNASVVLQQRQFLIGVAQADRQHAGELGHQDEGDALVLVGEVVEFFE